jgi:hypothetical protein
MPRWWPGKNNHPLMKKKLTDLKITRHLNLSFVAVILTVLILAGCSSTHKSAGKKLTAKGFTLTYTDKAQAGEEIRELLLQHPLPITERQMVYHMVALTYENYSLLGKAGPVFTKDDINKIKRLLTKSLNKAHSQNIVGFEVESEEGTTKGELFASQGNLHWRFSEIQGVKYSLTRNQLARYGTAWRLVPKKGQKFHQSEKLLGASERTNWVEAKINLSAPSNLRTGSKKKKRMSSGTTRSRPSTSKPSRPKSSTPRKSTADLEEKLKFLKHLHENNLIDKREYEQKRKDLLDQYL